MPWISRRKLTFELEGRALAPCHFSRSDACSVKAAARLCNRPSDVSEQCRRLIVACPGFEPAATLLKRSLIRRYVSLLSRENSLFR